MIKTAIMIDGAFYRKRAFYFWGDKTPEKRAQELVNYCKRHIKEEKAGAELYRIFYYDCPPSTKRVYHPLLKKQIDLSQSEQFEWANKFFLRINAPKKICFAYGTLGRRTSNI